MATIAKNTTASGINVPDMSGLYIEPFGQADLRLYFSIDEIEWSLDLKNHIEAGRIILNDGEKDLSQQESLDHQTLDTRFEVPHSFIDLDDTPSTLSGAENLYVRVNASGTNLTGDYADATYIKGTFVDETDIQDGYLLRYDNIDNHLHYEDIGSILDVYGYFGARFHSETSEEESSTTSTTLVNKLTMTVSGVPIGSYRVGWYYEWQMDNSSFNFVGQINLVGPSGTEVIMEHTERPANSASWAAHTGFYYHESTVSGTASYDVVLDFASGSPGKSASIRRSRLEFWRVQ